MRSLELLRWSLAGLALLVVPCAPSESDLVVDGERIRIELDDQLHSRMVSKWDDVEIALGEFTPSEALKVGDELLTDFTMEQIYGALPKAKELGFQWVVLDDGWQTAEGDWYLLPDKFPRGDADMKAFVDRIHAEGLKAKLWWAPLAADPGTDLLETHPDYLLLGEDGSPQRISYWHAFYLCPACPPVVEHTRQLVNTMMQVWGYDGFKLDGQHLNGVAPCYNQAHNHAYPEESVEQLAEYYRELYETALSLKPEAVVEICPCSTAFTFFSLPYMNQSVSSDPRSSWQIRHKGKTLKALSGQRSPTTATTWS